MLEDEFKLYHEKGKLYAVITIKGITYEMDVTDYFDSDNPHDEWLDYRLGLRELAEKSKFKEDTIREKYK
jgi:hypothetical protein